MTRRKRTTVPDFHARRTAIWRGLTSSPELRPSEPSWLDERGGMAAPVGITPGQRRWLNKQYPAGTADRVDAVVRAANGGPR